MLEQAIGTPLERFVQFSEYTIGETAHPDNRAFEGRRVGEIAAELGLDPFECVVHIAIKDDFATMLWPAPAGDGAADWKLRAEFWNEEDVLLGGSDAGAHLDRTVGAAYPTRFLADCIRGRRLMSVERAVQLMSSTPATMFGLIDRGAIRVGAFADMVVFDPKTVGSGPVRRAYDLAGGGMRLTADSIGVRHVFVNGVEAVRDSQLTGSLSGTVLRSGASTTTVKPSYRAGQGRGESRRGSTG
jgi:N-acyl-D-aspartate/D-glutamate deacylase